MTWLRRILARRQIHADLSAEIRAHLEEKVEALIADGMPRKEAEHAARRQFGNVLLTEERSREVWRWPHLEDFLIDLRYALRLLRKSKGFAAVAILTLALGIGANTALFSMVNGILLRELPYPHPARVYEIYQSMRMGSQVFPWEPANAGNYLEWKRRCHSFSALAELAPSNGSLDLPGGAVPVHGASITASLLPLLGVQPVLGRNFLPDEDQVGHNQEIILTNSFWREYFHSDPKILGKAIHMNGWPFTVVGVLPPNFYFPRASRLYRIPVAGWKAPIQFFLPLFFQPYTEKPGTSFTNYAAFARLKPGVSPEHATADLDAVQASIVKRDPKAAGAGVQLTARLVPLKRAITEPVTAGLWTLLAGAAVMLLVVCVNLAGLLLSRNLARSQEFAVRTALGALRWNLLRQFLAEGLLLATAGGALGLLLAYAGLKLLVRIAPASIPRLGSISIDARVLLFTTGISLLVSLLFATLPAFRLSRVSPGDALKGAWRSATAVKGTVRLRNALAAAEIAMCAVLLVSALLLARSLERVLEANSWMAASHVVTFRLGIPATRTYWPSSSRYRLYQTLLHKVRAVPGVQSAGLINALPLKGTIYSAGLSFQEAPRQPANTPLAEFRFVSPGYFRASGVRLTAGRYFSRDDADKPVAVISQGAARQVPGGRDPLGMHVLFSASGAGKRSPYRIIGIVADARTSPDKPAPPTVYIPDWSYSAWQESLVVRALGDPLAVAGEVRQAIRDQNREVSLPAAETMKQVLDRATAPRRFLTLLGLLFAGFAGLLATLGLYGVISLGVTQRTQEMGIRIALGAEPWRILRLVLGQGARLGLLGVAIGIAGGLAAARWLQSFLYGVRPTDPVTLMSVATLLSVVILLACYFPARRATRVDPATALRNE